MTLLHLDPARYWVTPWQAARLSGRRYVTIRRWVAEGRVKVRGDGRVWLWSVFDQDDEAPRRQAVLDNG